MPHVSNLCTTELAHVSFVTFELGYINKLVFGCNDGSPDPPQSNQGYPKVDSYQSTGQYVDSLWIDHMLGIRIKQHGEQSW
jgi:hypothetical protein